MAGLLEKMISMGRNRNVRPTMPVGVMGTALYGGYIQDAEESKLLKDGTKYKTYSEMLANVSIVAAGVRYFLNLTAKAKWNFTPSDDDPDGMYAEIAEAILTDDPRTPWHRIVRRAAMYRFYGFSVQEWTARRREDGVMTLADVSPRAQRTIERWDVDDVGDVIGMYQRSPQTQAELYLPRMKTLYMVDDTLTDSPEGLGIFRHLVAPAKRLQEYERLEGVGFETDLRGVPVGRGPFTALAKMVKDGLLTKKDREALEKPMRDFIRNHVRGPKSGLLLDSQPYVAEDDAARPSSTPQWSLDLLKASSTSLPELANSISRVNREMARVLGVEQLLLGEDSAGSFALSKDKTNSFFLLVDGTLRELAETVRDDLLKTVWKLNGWPPEAMPKLSTEAVRFQDVDQVTAALRDMAQAGAPLEIDDPAIGEVRDLLGLSRPPEDGLDGEVDAGLNAGRGEPKGSPDDPEAELPYDETKE